MAGNHRRLLLAVSLGALLLVLGVAVRALQVVGVERVSVSSTGAQANKACYCPCISADGRFIAFCSGSTTLVPGDTNVKGDVFVRDRQSGRTERVSVSSAGEQANDHSIYPSISGDGRYVAFVSAADNLVPGADRDYYLDSVFVRDRATGLTTVLLASDGKRAGVLHQGPSISADGRFVAFVSVIHDVANYQVFLYDRLTDLTELVSVGPDGRPGNADSAYGYGPAVSADGRFVAFGSAATNLVPGDTTGDSDVFVRDRQSGQTARVNVPSAGGQANGGGGAPSLSADGRFVAFFSDATNLVPGDTNREFDVFLHDRQTGVTERVSLSSSGEQGNDSSFYPSVTADGRLVAFLSYASNLVPGDTAQPDVFVRDRRTGRTERVSLSISGEEGDKGSSEPSISADGRYVAFESSASNLVPGDSNGCDDVFVAAIAPGGAGHAVSGTVRRSGGAAVPGVCVTAKPGGALTYTASDGSYQLSGLATGTYTVAPAKPGFTFSPASRSVTVGPDHIGVDFTASPGAGDGVVRYWAVLVGVANYPGTKNDLKYADDDAVDMRDTLIAGGAWRTMTLLNSQATLDAIRTMVTWMFKRADADDVCLFYFSGHGTTVADQPPLDESDGKDEALYPYGGGYLTDDTFAQWMAACPTTKYAVILDACFSGGQVKSVAAEALYGATCPREAGRVRSVFGAGAPARGSGFAEDLRRGAIGAADLNDAHAGVVLTACDDTEDSMELPGLENGVFTWCLVRALGAAGSDANGNGKVSAEEAFAVAGPLTVGINPFQHPLIYDANRGKQLDLVSVPAGSAAKRRATDAQQARVTGLTVSASKAGGAQLTFTLASASAVAVRILNAAGREVRALCRAKPYQAGTAVLLWDGRSDQGVAVPNGDYLVEVVANAAGGASVRAVARCRITR